MNVACLDYLLTEEERLTFEQNGFLVLENVLSEDQINRLTQAVDRIDRAERAASA